MKKLFVLLASACIVFTACPQKPNPDPNPDPVPDPNPTPVDTMSVDEQKELIESTFTKFLEQFPSKEYEDLMELAQKFYEYGEENFDDYFDASEVEDAWEDELLDEVFSEEENRNGIYEYIIKASKCTGTIIVDGDVAEFEKSSDMKVIVKDVDGEDWTLTVVPTSWAYDVYLGTFDDESVTVDLPSQVKIDVKAGAKKYAEIEVNYTYNLGAEGDGLDPNGFNFSVSTTFSIDDVTLTVSNTGYDAVKGEAKTAVTLKRGATSILATTFLAQGQLRIDDDLEEVRSWEVNSASYSFDFLGDVQIVAFAKEADNFIDDLAEEEVDFFGEKDEMKKLAAELNEIFTVGVCYQQKNEIQAKIVADYIKGDEGEYYVAPVLEFADESSYSFIEFYEDHIEKDLDDWAEELEDFVNDYIDLINDIFDEEIDEISFDI